MRQVEVRQKAARCHLLILGAFDNVDGEPVTVVPKPNLWDAERGVKLQLVDATARTTTSMTRSDRSS